MSIFFCVFLWFIPEKSDSYAEPTEALLAIDRNLLLIPSYKYNDESLYFFIKDNQSLGASYVQKGMFGWKTELLTSSRLAASLEEKDLQRYQRHGTRLIYGLLENGEDYFVEVNGERAVMVNLAMLQDEIATEYNLQDMFIWYFESDTALDKLDKMEIKLFDSNTNELTDSF